MSNAIKIGTKFINEAIKGGREKEKEEGGEGERESDLKR